VLSIQSTSRTAGEEYPDQKVSLEEQVCGEGLVHQKNQKKKGFYWEEEKPLK
jgi:hypothetical protein